MEFAQRLESLLAEKEISSYRLSKDTGITQATIHYWREKGVLPDGVNLIKLADYFEVSIDFLVGRKDSRE